MSIGKELGTICQNRKLVIRKLFQDAVAECKKSAAIGMHSTTYFVDEDVQEGWVQELCDLLEAEDFTVDDYTPCDDGYYIWIRWFE